MLKLPVVMGIGIGKKGRKEVMKVFVSHQVQESALRSNDIISEVRDGYGTNVEEIGVVTAQT